MNDCVVDIPVPSFSPLTMQSRDDEMMELFWQPLDDQWSFTKPPSSNSADTALAPPPPPPSSQPQGGNINNRADNEAAPRLNYSLEGPRPIYPNNLNPATSGPPINRPSLQPGRWPVSSKMEGGNLPPLERFMSAGFTVVDSNDTPEAVITEGPVVGPDCPPGSPIMIASIGQGGAVSVSTSSATDSANATTDAAVFGEVGGKVVCRKRKRIDNDERSLSTTPTNTIDAQTEDLEVESDDGKKNSHGSTATNKRARSAEVHNLSERRRRDRINEKMKALQELIPRCNKLDKASMLDEAIDYLKSLQMQVQMMSSMGSGMMPMMYPGMQQPYMPIPPMSMGTGMGITTIPPPGIPIPVPSPLSIPGPSVMPPLAPILPPSPLAIPSSPMIDSTGNPYGLQIPGIAKIPNMPADPFQQYMAYQRMQMQMQMQAIMSQPLPQPALSKPTPSGSGGDDNNDKDKDG